MKTLDIRVAFSALDKLSRPVNAARQSVGGLSESLKKTEAAVGDLGSQAKGFNRLRDSVQGTTRKIDDASRALNGLKLAQQQGVQLTDKQREHMTSLTAKLERLNAVRAKEMEKLRGASQALRRHGVSLAGGDQTIQSAIRRTEQYNQTLERERQALARVMKARAAYDRAQELGEKMQTGGAVAMAAAGGAMYAGASMLAPQTDAEGRGAVIAAGSGEGAADGKRYTRVIQDLSGRGISSDLAQAAEAVSVVRSALGALGEVGDSELSRISRKALDMQKAFGGDLSEQIQASAILMKNGLAGSSDEAVDLMVAGMQRMSAGMRAEIPEILHEYSTHFRNMGFTGAETMSLLVSMAQQGKFALDKTGDAIKEFSIRGSDMSKNSVAAYDLLGLNAAAMSSAIASGGEQARAAMQKTARALLSVRDPAERANAAIALFGTPIEDLSIDQIPAFLTALSGASNKLDNIQGAADRMGAALRDNLPGDIALLTGALSGLRGDVFGGFSGDLRGVVQSATEWINQLREWVQANPELSTTLGAVSGGLLGLVMVMGGASLVLGVLLGPLAKLRLGFTLLTGSTGLGRAIPMFTSLRTVAGGAMGSIRGWSSVLSSVSAGAGRLTGLLTPLRGMLLTAFLSPGVALRTLSTGILRLLLSLSGLPALWGMVTGAVSMLGGALSFLLSPIGLIGALFVAAAVLIWKYWGQIGAFFSGFFTGISARLAPLRDAFSRFSPLFDMVGEAVSRLWNWFKELFTPVEASKETLEKCASAGEVFGNVLGGALQLVLAPAKMLLDVLAWILEKLGVLPDEAERARKKIEDAQRQALLSDKIALLQGDLEKVAPKKTGTKKDDSSKNGVGHSGGVGAGSLNLGGCSSNQKNLQKIADNTGGMLKETKKRIGPGDIVFKNLPRALAVRGEWQESRLVPPPAMTTSRLAPVIKAASQPVIQAILPPVKTPADTARNDRAAAGFGGDIHVHLHNVTTNKPRELARLVGEMVKEEMTRLSRTGRSSFKDQD